MTAINYHNSMSSTFSGTTYYENLKKESDQRLPRDTSLSTRILIPVCRQHGERRISGWSGAHEEFSSHTQYPCPGNVVQFAYFCHGRVIPLRKVADCLPSSDRMPHSLSDVHQKLEVGLGEHERVGPQIVFLKVNAFVRVERFA